MFLETLLLITIVMLLVHIVALIWIDVRTAKRQEEYLKRLEIARAKAALTKLAAKKLKSVSACRDENENPGAASWTSSGGYCS